ncbi:GntR family transcriptional regulator [Xenorhabdus sp. VLS]|uniref:GntR family transcriptional regulator n=1 Tax=Xenorhabdus lircayensis TaxID=2763499 RepID=A0ABS0U8V1_9GAMM|nr:GntR family transcriptional regulator [Xenorhabdus lircayensis]
MMNIADPKRPYQEVGHSLRQMIITDHYAVGDRLPPECEITEMLGVSRTLVREAVFMLELENLIEVRKGYGRNSGIYILQLPKTAETYAENAAEPFE